MIDEQVTADHIAQIVSRWTGVPVDKMLAGEREKLLGMEAALHQRVVGQDEAVSAVSRAVRRARAGLQDPSRPIGSFYFWAQQVLVKPNSLKPWRRFYLMMKQPSADWICQNIWKSIPWRD